MLFRSKALKPDVAALMLTNPSTLGLFESNIEKIAHLVHQNGSYLYYDGANLNALMGIARPGDMGFDMMHINTHKTLSTPHGGGGPGAGPIAVKSFLKDYLPLPRMIKKNNRFQPLTAHKKSIGRIGANYGHIGIILKAYCYILSLGAEGLKQASQTAVLNANYIQNELKDVFKPYFDKLCMHECLLDGSGLPFSVSELPKYLQIGRAHV